MQIDKTPPNTDNGRATGLRFGEAHHGEQIARLEFLCLNVEITINFKRLDLFRKFQRLFNFTRRDYNFLTVDAHAQWHREARNNPFIIKRNGFAVYAVLQ